MNLRKQRAQFAAVAMVGAALAAPLAFVVARGAREARLDLRRQPLQGELVDIGGYRLHVRTAGLDRPGPMVLFEAGLSCPQDAWAWIQPEVARFAPTITYDRAGLGGSDRSPHPRTAARMTDELDLLLQAIGTSGPLVIVAHSFGGLLARSYAARHPDRVVGIVLADVSHPDQFERSRGQRAGMPIMRMQVRQAATMAKLGFNRFTKSHVMTGIKALPEGDYRRALARVLTAKACRTACDELDGWLANVNDEVRDTVLPDGCPLAVVSAGRVVAQDPVHGTLQADLATLSSQGTWHCVDDADHLGLIMDEAHASEVTRAVLDVVDRARKEHQDGPRGPAVPHRERP